MRHHQVKDLLREQKVFNFRAWLAAALMGAALLLVASRLFWLQVVEYDEYLALSQGNRVKVDPLSPDRGLLLDREGRVLAENVPALQLTLTREQVTDLDETLAELARLGLLNPAAVDDARSEIRSKRAFQAVSLGRLDEREAAVFAVNRHRLPGVALATRPVRRYPYGPVAAHALGYVGAISEDDEARLEPERRYHPSLDQIGKAGLEKSYERVLHGIGGFRDLLVNAEGRSVTGELADSGMRRELPVAGDDLVLSLDIELQQAAETAMTGRRGAVIAMDPWNGDVLVLASLPTYDPNLFSQGISTADYGRLTQDPDQPLFNRALRGTYPPGSTIKPLMALVGLENGVVTPEDSRFCRGFFTLPNSSHRYRDWKREGHGTVDMREAVMTSCDVYFYSLAATLGIERIHDSMSRYGFGKPTGLDVDGESAGIMPSPAWKKGAFRSRENQVWFPGETVIVGIGQGYWTATPMQLAHATALLATRGKHFKPRLVRGQRDPASGRVRERPPVPLEPVRLQDEDSWQVIVDAMVAVTSGPRGTAARAASGAGYSIAGKTGTAQVFSIGQNERYDEKAIDERLRDHALFVAFAPAEDPKLVVSVLVENGGSGSAVAAPVARAVFDAYLKRTPR